MESIATCSCGDYNWIIYAGRIECAKCGKEYKLHKEVPSTRVCDMVNDPENFFVLGIQGEQPVSTGV